MDVAIGFCAVGGIERFEAADDGVIGGEEQNGGQYGERKEGGESDFGGAGECEAGGECGQLCRGQLEAGGEAAAQSQDGEVAGLSGLQDTNSGGDGEHGGGGSGSVIVECGEVGVEQ